jgi:hypothetical protein
MKRAVAAIASLLTIAAIGVGAPPASAEGMTTITLKIRNCDGCTVQPMLLREDADGAEADYTGTKVKVSDGVAVMTVPTDDTPGMSFLVDGPGTENIDALPVLVVQYKGYAPGTVVTRAQAKAAKKGSGCWLGTSASSVTLRARAMTVRLPAFEPAGATTVVTAAWLVPTGNAAGGFDQATKGVIATQNSGWPCNAG